MKRVAITLAIGLSGLLAVTCGSTSPTSPTLPAALAFTAAPMDISNIGSITPIGNLNPPGHTLPTDHMYLYHSTPTVPVFAPAGGVVFEARRGADDAVYVNAAAGTFYYLAHIVLDSKIQNGSQLTAGQSLGVTSTLAQALDLGVSNNLVTLLFAKPARYPPQTLHADSPLKYFDEPLRTAMYSRVNRGGPDKDGRIDFDRIGTLSGNWFLEGLPIADSMNVANGPKHLAFARDVADPTLLRISIGGSLSMSGAFWLSDAATDPQDITPSTGLVSYTLYANPAVRTGPGAGELLVQMLTAERIQIETFGSGTTPSGFTSASLFYVR